MTSFCMQFEKGHGLLREVFRREGECIVGQKRGGGNKKGSVLENALNAQNFGIACKLLFTSHNTIAKMTPGSHMKINLVI